MSPDMAQRCGNCKWFVNRSGVSGFDEGEGACMWLEATMPSAYVNHHTYTEIRPHTFSEHGATCPTWHPQPRGEDV